MIVICVPETKQIKSKGLLNMCPHCKVSTQHKPGSWRDDDYDVRGHDAVDVYDDGF